VTRRTLADGTEVALLHDAAAIADHAAAESAVAVAATAVENARQERQVRERIEHLRSLRRGMLAAADEERRLLEDELRLGPLREADRLDELLGRVPGGRAQTLRRELALARAELMEIARGLYPAALARDGLAASLRAAADGAPLPVEFDAQIDAPVPEPIALTAYYVASEALANVAKHAGAAGARVELSTRDGWLTVRVSDGGAGGADPRGHGLRGLRDRVATVDGVMRVVSPPGGGTVIEARLPLRAAPGAPANERSGSGPRR
jgi:signal transduction histidine kinase